MQPCALCGGAASSKMHIVGILSTTLLWCISPGVVATTFSLLNRCTNQNKLLISDLKILEIYLSYPASWVLFFERHRWVLFFERHHLICSKSNQVDKLVVHLIKDERVTQPIQPRCLAKNHQSTVLSDIFFKLTFSAYFNPT